ncbi:hypothetical protein HXX76_000632 [Chlamydomonas incerta]|uniref:Uncharacterized protein n=1 Tax=Chlamydomonas incerta TaxID=51695 RepID=A0A836B2S3_CHLIN|nr:hypothetical protein HXX76_000632 [Chlamydomonas incerta]|eukprot:KAG2446030.1 hypothetical protein HXX76_000632 [Chlamydomonas incerta]
MLSSSLAGTYSSRVVGSMTVMPGPVQQDGMSHVRIRVDLLDSAHVFIAPSGSPNGHNLRIAITRRLPEDCASTEFYHAGVHVDPTVYGRGVGVHVPLPDAVYSCSAAVTDPFIRAVFIRVDLDLSTELGGGTKYTVSVGNPQDLLVPGCPYNIMYGACNPAACNATSASAAAPGPDGSLTAESDSGSQDHAQHSGSSNGTASATGTGAEQGASPAAASSSGSSSSSSTAGSSNSTGTAGAGSTAGGDLVASELPAATGPDPPGTPAANAARSSASSSTGGGGINVAAIVAGAVGGAAVVAAALAGFMYVRARRRRAPRESTNGALAQTLMWPGGVAASPVGGAGASPGVGRFTVNGGSSGGGTTSGGGTASGGVPAVALPLAVAVTLTPTSRMGGADTAADSEPDDEGAGPSSLAATLNAAAAGLFAAAKERGLVPTHSSRNRLGGGSGAAGAAAAGESFISYPGLPTCRTTAMPASPSPAPSPGGDIELSVSSQSTSKDSRRCYLDSLDRGEDSAPDSPLPQRVAAPFEAGLTGAGTVGGGGGAGSRGGSRGPTSHGQDLSSLVVGAVQPPTSFDRRSSARRSTGGGMPALDAQLQQPQQQLQPQQQQRARVLPVVVAALPAAAPAAPAPARGLSWKRRSGRFGSAIASLMGGVGGVSPSAAAGGPAAPHTSLSGAAHAMAPAGTAAALSGGASEATTPCITEHGGALDLFAMPPPPQLDAIPDTQDAASVISTTSFSAAPSLFGCLPAPAPAAGARPLLRSARNAGTGASDAPGAAAAAPQEGTVRPGAPEVSVLVAMPDDDNGTEYVAGSGQPARRGLGSRVRRLLR